MTPVVASQPFRNPQLDHLLAKKRYIDYLERHKSIEKTLVEHQLADEIEGKRKGKRQVMETDGQTRMDKTSYKCVRCTNPITY